MDNLLGILLLAVAGFLFWQQRRQAELAQTFIHQRCEHLGLQLLTVASGSHKLRDSQGLWHWHTVYLFEFSASGEDAYQGYVVMKGFRPVQFHVPPHRMPG
ncbi:DUF3301 domain-containing protein [Photobacterium ganghwense]|uniref:DUF3301 domain-containing protein n=1 Tax=Photobacterium ganghwense TaxID=320778 RepID=A0A0J1HJG0_9GAMM|nr:DUF3301 domain-containing protein [Photobacterium ganghwense]KLV11730.1 hypothetical protein ABT57_00275 [Photobacterium ganghwense]PSU04589.1 DUF3301 domain-containing protein [Photobacterium ganghwense]QSV14630.1 DUF3301 domain-containing protein [Photobacterium ganghwense]